MRNNDESNATISNAWNVDTERKKQTEIIDENRAAETKIQFSEYEMNKDRMSSSLFLNMSPIMPHDLCFGFVKVECRAY